MSATLPSYEDALRAAIEVVSPIDADEVIALADALGRVLAAPIQADRDLPPFNRAQMDGYALRASEFVAEKPWPVVATIAAGRSAADVRVPPGSCVAIATGAPLPDDLDTVIQHEVSDRGDLRGEPVRFSIDSITPGHAVHPRGADAKKGAVLLEAPLELAPQHLGIAASVGAAKLHTLRRPRVALLTSGDEVVGVEQLVDGHRIRNSNAPMLTAFLAQCGADVTRVQHLPDEPQPTIEAVGRALPSADLVITVGGVSAGDRDHFPAAFDEHGVNRLVYGASLQPGRPIFIGQASGSSPATVVGLPGNPVSALVCANLFIRPILRAMLGFDALLPWRSVALGEAVRPNPNRQAFRPAVLDRDAEGIERVRIPRWAGSGDLAHTAGTSGIAALPVQRDEVPAGTMVKYAPWPGCYA